MILVEDSVGLLGRDLGNGVVLGFDDAVDLSALGVLRMIVGNLLTLVGSSTHIGGGVLGTERRNRRDFGFEAVELLATHR